MIREDRDNPVHVREYTSRELHTLAKAVGFEVVAVTLSNYHSHASSKSILGRVVSVARDADRSSRPPGYGFAGATGAGSRGDRA